MKKIDVHLHASSVEQVQESMAYLQKKGVAHAILMSVDETELNREICAGSRPALDVRNQRGRSQYRV